jgi:hypothetical protein
VIAGRSLSQKLRDAEVIRDPGFRRSKRACSGLAESGREAFHAVGAVPVRLSKLAIGFDLRLLFPGQLSEVRLEERPVLRFNPLEGAALPLAAGTIRDRGAMKLVGRQFWSGDDMPARAGLSGLTNP